MILSWFYHAVLDCRAQAAPLRRRCPCTQARIFSDQRDEIRESRQGAYRSSDGD